MPFYDPNDPEDMNPGALAGASLTREQFRELDEYLEEVYDGHNGSQAAYAIQFLGIEVIP